MPMSIGSFFTPWWVVEEAEEELREGERWPPPGNYIDHVDHVQSDDGIDNHNNWMGRRKRQERAALHLVETANCLPGLPLPPT